ncbi:unnamed protein product, partial [Rotaria magnacalcarata]
VAFRLFLRSRSREALRARFVVVVAAAAVVGRRGEFLFLGTRGFSSSSSSSSSFTKLIIGFRDETAPIDERR